jgi:hypothetical protein
VSFRFSGFGVFVCWGLWYIFGLFVISVFAGLLPVVSCVLIDKWLIINAIQFSGMHALSGGVSLSGPLIYLILLIMLFWVVILVCCHIGFVFNFRFIAGVFMHFDR